MKNIEILSDDEKTIGALRSLRSNKIYPKILEALDCLGSFDREVDAEIFSDDKALGKTELVLYDNNGTMFILNARSNFKNDLNLIRVVGEDDITYDLSLIKKSEITNDNIDLCRSSDVYNTKHGRLISDRKTFVSLFFGNTAYQLLANFENNIPIKLIVDEVNFYNVKPSFKEFIESVEAAVPPYEIDNVIEINAYDHFEKVGNVKLKEGTAKVKKL